MSSGARNIGIFTVVHTDQYGNPLLVAEFKPVAGMGPCVPGASGAGVFVLDVANPDNPEYLGPVSTGSPDGLRCGLATQFYDEARQRVLGPLIEQQEVLRTTLYTSEVADQSPLPPSSRAHQ